ncbi:Photosystem I P700 chlorophyll a apoprotein A2 [Halioglobus japonicus]|nr:Photosystem I P700 chlorophyll a apoprotein A2 [Halioglobus japonicus]
MYEIFYNFSAEPFRLSPDHRFCFEHNSYGKARAYLAYAFKRAEGFVMITGRPGTGKTTLIGELIESLSTDKVITANLVCTQLQADDLLKTVAYSFGVSPTTQGGKAELMQHLSVLLHSWHREGRRALLVVDEAQDLSSSAMEELRLLTNIQFGGQPLLQIFLLGQPELRDLILSREMEQVHQRIVAASHIEGLEADETEAYVMHRLSRVGWQGDPAIDRAIFPLIHRFSEGVPRRINLICSRLFLLGSVEERHAIEVKDVSVVIGELQAENLAAGTGISREDFRNSAEPDWVPVPDIEGQAAPHLQGDSSAPAQAGDSNLVEQSVEVKKKDNPDTEAVAQESIEPSGDDGPDISNASPERSDLPAGEGADVLPETELNSVSGDTPDTVTVSQSESADEVIAEGPDEGVVGHSSAELASDVAQGVVNGEVRPILDEEARSEGESEVRPLLDDETADSDLSADSSPSYASGNQVLAEASDQSIDLNDTPNDLVDSGGAIVSPGPRKRLIFIACLMAVTLSVALILKTCVVTQDDQALPEMGQGTSPGDTQSLSPSGLAPLENAAVNVRAVAAEDVVPESSSSERPVKPNTKPALRANKSAEVALVSDSVAELPEGDAVEESLVSDSAEELPESGSVEELPVSDSAAEQQELLPMVVEAGLRLFIPAATAEDNQLTEVVPEKTRSDENESPDPGPSKESVRDAVPSEDAVAVEIAAQQSSQETFLISFSFDSDDLVSDVLPELDRVAEIMRENDAAVASITGFTDNLGDSQYNLRLSRKRASAVERYLVDAGIDRERLQVEGRGVLSDPFEGPVSEIDDAMEPYRIVQIKLLSEG